MIKLSSFLSFSFPERIGMICILWYALYNKWFIIIIIIIIIIIVILQFMLTPRNHVILDLSYLEVYITTRPFLHIMITIDCDQGLKPWIKLALNRLTIVTPNMSGWGA